MVKISNYQVCSGIIVLMPLIKVILDVFRFLHFLFKPGSLLGPYIILPKLQEVDKK